MKKNNTNLNPCPFCNGDAALKESSPDQDGLKNLYIECEDCKAVFNGLGSKEHLWSDSDSIEYINSVVSKFNKRPHKRG